LPIEGKSGGYNFKGTDLKKEMGGHRGSRKQQKKKKRPVTQKAVKKNALMRKGRRREGKQF